MTGDGSVLTTLDRDNPASDGCHAMRNLGVVVPKVHNNN